MSVIGVFERVVLVVILMVPLCIIELCESNNFRHNGFTEPSGFAEGLFRFFG